MKSEFIRTMVLLPLFLVLNVGWVAANAVGHTHTTCEGAVCRALVANSEAIMVRTLFLCWKRFNGVCRR